MQKDASHHSFLCTACIWASITGQNTILFRDALIQLLIKSEVGNCSKLLYNIMTVTLYNPVNS